MVQGWAILFILQERERAFSSFEHCVRINFLTFDRFAPVMPTQKVAAMIAPSPRPIRPLLDQGIEQASGRRQHRT